MSMARWIVHTDVTRRQRCLNDTKVDQSSSFQPLPAFNLTPCVPSLQFNHNLQSRPHNHPPPTTSNFKMATGDSNSPSKRQKRNKDDEATSTKAAASNDVVMGEAGDNDTGDNSMLDDDTNDDFVSTLNGRGGFSLFPSVPVEMCLCAHPSQFVVVCHRNDHTQKSSTEHLLGEDEVTYELQRANIYLRTKATQQLLCSFLFCTGG
jgi:hypothetical protein